jgi:hypothetical protein
MTRRMIARAAVVLVAVGFGLGGVVALPASADKPSVPATLDGESLSGTPSFSNEACNPNGTSSFDYSANGVASGPYPGTFSETGTVTVAAQTIPNRYEIPFGTLTFTTGTLATVAATFTIQSSAGVVTGTKTLVTYGLGACENTAQLESLLYGNQTISVTLRQAQTGPGGLSYAASIPANKKTYCDNGTSTLRVAEFVAGTLGTLESPNFTESFATSGSLAREHGHETC